MIFQNGTKITQKSIFLKSPTWFTSYTHIDYIDVFSFFQLQIRTSYSACRRSPQIQHASGELLQCRYFIIFSCIIFFVMYLNIFSITTPSIIYLSPFLPPTKKLSKKRIILGLYSGVTL